MPGQRLQSISALLAAAVLLLLLWAALVPAAPEEVAQLPQATPIPSATASQPTPQPTPAADGELALGFRTSALPSLVVFQADSYTIPLRIYNDSAETVSDIGVGLTWMRGDEARRAGQLQMISLPPYSALTTTFTVDGGLFAGPGSYTYQAFVRVFVSEHSRGSVIGASAVGVLTILPPDADCETAPNLRLLSESLRVQNGTATVRVRNEGHSALSGVVVHARLEDGPAEWVTSYQLGELAPCGGEALALLSLGEGAEPGSGSTVRIWVEALPDDQQQAVAEETLDDNALLLQIQ